MTYARIEKQIAGRVLSLETGKLAKQADGAVVVRYGDSMVLVTAQSAQAREGIDFFPLTVEYREKMSAGGKFPGGFIKREGRPSQREVLTCRLIDRPIRPLFPKGYRNEVQIIGNLLSADPDNDPDVHAITGASAALTVSSIPFGGPIAAVRVGLVDDEFVLYPTAEEREKSLLDLVVAGTSEAVCMVEAGAKFVTEEDVVEAIEFAHEAIREIVGMIEELREKAGKPKQEFEPPASDEELIARLEQAHGEALRKALTTGTKLERKAAVEELRARAVAEECAAIADEEEREEAEKRVGKAFDEMCWRAERGLILEKGVRVDGRKPDEVRDITIEVGLLPRTHGSALFTRGETQALVVTALGTGEDEQRVEHVLADFSKRFYLDYNFPPYSVGEVRPIRGVGRREIGHGALAERALEPVIPDEESFSYTIRVVSDILESNGSSSMATVCGATLSMMDAGVPLKEPVAGIAMGLVTDGDRYRVLTDIAGSEDHNGDMDFKVAGTRDGITALQMDIKITGVTQQILSEALEQARKARLFVLDKMHEAMPAPRPQVSKYAPRLKRLQIPVEKIGVLIGPGGRQIKAIQETTGAEVEVDDHGVVLVSGPSEEVVEKAAQMVRAVTAEVEVGQVFEGKVISIKDFGAFVEIAPGQEGLCHVSELAQDFVRDVSDVVKLGDVIRVKVIQVDPTGRIKLSRKAVLVEEGGDGAAAVAEESRPALAAEAGAAGGNGRGGEGRREGGGGEGRRRRRRGGGGQRGGPRGGGGGARTGEQGESRPRSSENVEKGRRRRRHRRGGSGGESRGR